MRVCAHRRGQASAQLECANKSLTEVGRVPLGACSSSDSQLLHTLSPAITMKYSVTCHIPELWPGATQPIGSWQRKGWATQLLKMAASVFLP